MFKYKDLTSRPSRDWDDLIKMCLKEVCGKGVKWIRLVRTTCKWRASANTLISFSTMVLMVMTPCSLAYLVSTRRRNTLLPSSAGIKKSRILCIDETLVSIKASNFLSIWATVSFSRRILSYGFKYKHTHTHSIYSHASAT
jgi:hypothetical protein